MIENMWRLTRGSAAVMTASPDFYSGGQRVEQMVDIVVSRVFGQLGVDNALVPRYGEPARRRHPEEE